MTSVPHYVRFLAAVLFCGGLIYGDLHLSVFNNLRGDMSQVLVPFRAAALLPRRLYRGTADYFRAREELLAEKARLEQQIVKETVRLKSFDFFLRQNDDLRLLLGLKNRLQGDWLTAEALRNVSRSAGRQVLLDKGIINDVLPGMAVVNAGGVLGQVIRADANTSIVGLLTDPGQWISARVQRNNLLVLLRGSGAGLAIEYVSNDADIKEGDLLVADGGVYPPGYPVAVVASLEEGKVYKEGRARPASDFSDNSFVLIYQTSGQAAPVTPGLR